MLAHRHSWECHRLEPREGAKERLCLSFGGVWADYDFMFQWSKEMDCLHLTAIFGVETAAAKKADLNALLTHINQGLWFGFFCFNEDEDGAAHILFRHSHLFSDGVSIHACQTLVEIARAALDEWSPSFYMIAQGASLADSLLARQKMSAA